MNNEVREQTSTKGTKCCVPGCASKNKGSTNVSMYPFPDQETNLISYRCWLREMRACKAEAGEPFVHHEDAMVCELHFRDEDFVLTSQTGEKCLKFGTVPFLKNCSTSNSDNDVRVLCTKQKQPSDDSNPLQKERITNILKGRKNKNLNSLKKEIQQQKSLSHQRLMQEKELQEEKLRQLLLKQEEHRKVTKKQKEQKQEEERFEAVTKRDYQQGRLNREQQIKELEEYQRQLREAETQLKKNTSKHIEKTQVATSSTNKNNNNNYNNEDQVWKKKKATLQMKLEQQRERLIEIQQQELLYEKNNNKIKKKRKHPTTIVVFGDDEDEDTIETSGGDNDNHVHRIPGVAVTTATSSIIGNGNNEPKKSVAVATPSVISCGKCLKLESDLQLISQQYLILKKENERLKLQLLHRR